MKPFEDLEEARLELIRISDSITKPIDGLQDAINFSLDLPPTIDFETENLVVVQNSEGTGNASTL